MPMNIWRISFSRCFDNLLHVEFIKEELQWRSMLVYFIYESQSQQLYFCDRICQS